MDIAQCLEVLVKHRTDEVVVASMTPVVYWPFLSRSKRDLLFTDPMGMVPDVALGIARDDLVPGGLRIEPVGPRMEMIADVFQFHRAASPAVQGILETTPL